MKKFIILILILLPSSFAFAEDTAESKEGPCKKIMDACKAADFAKGDHTMKKGLFKDCMQPLLAEPSQAVAGVKLEADVINACRKIKEQHLKNKNK